MRALRCQRRGLTAVEVVVVLIVLLTLLGLMLTYILRQRESALRVHCMNNLRRIGTALHSFHDVSGGAQPALAFLPAARIADGYATWAVQIAPHMDAAQLQAWKLERS